MAEAQRRYLGKGQDRKDRKREYLRGYRSREEYKKRDSERRKERYRGNPEKYKQEARARKERYRVNHTHDEWLGKVAEYGGRCAYCRGDGPLTKDHIIPVSRGDPATVDLIDNIVPSCKSCNSKKGSKLLSEWRAHD